MRSAIELTGLTKHFGDVVALDGVDLTVEEGEIFGFLGPNGAGKSTTIDTLLDFVRPTAGSARVLGMDAQAESLEIRRRVGVLPDAYRVYDRLTGRQHVQFAIDSKRTDDDPMALLERVGIADAADRKAGGYSKGMRQRLVLAMALVGEPDLLILDEPSTGLDPNGAREMRRLIREEAERGATVFFSSHILEQVEAICDRVAILNEGKIVTVDTIAGLRESAGSATELTITVDAVPDAALDALDALDGVQGVAATDRTITVTMGAGSKTAILDAIESAGAEMLDFRTSETSLEELFATFTTVADTDETAAELDDEAATEHPDETDDAANPAEVAR
ncbi:ABC transporter ATP-binding protein [Halapricum hydrolyticum]|uniref:ABC transporter ATP-binding protein n=1 Tax=Halapricum hydrolyticum TaxID=2979991 RepID=A0AAE3IBN0_9EURY|nr:ABC transporter ATP-binding protein [Halapricum hydrolyticum]MCU4718684.1 ABC transporter ATP-binding protein [Halapricum hydrolyticum]MCU4727630.1 ABC transporter ATP-binding protein [Halapricum hydrolyticum]